uniref:solute carrier family 10 member 6-like n=1 Tax=Styela clava TaxID=7725 RepID=UPI00193A42F5|nr:solute carrier family 10 member 6-like [Styela clava]
MEFTTTAGNATTFGNTTAGYEFDPQIEMFKILVTCILALVMFGMGCAVDHEKLINNFKRPIGILIGLGCQILMMPMIAYGLIKATSMSELQAITFMVVGCSPGGTFSNILAYMVDGDMPLSVALTTLSNLFALGTVPMWLFLYTWIEEVDENIQIPYSSLGITLASLIIPIVAGILFRYKFVKIAKYLAKGCAIFGFILLVAIVAAMLIRNDIPIVFSVKTILPIAVLPIAGMVISFCISLIPRLELSWEARRTIAIETSIQNGSLSTNVVFLTYGNRLNMFMAVITIPLLYSISQTIYNIILVVIYKTWKFYQKSRNRKFSGQSVTAVGYEVMEMT